MLVAATYYTYTTKWSLSLSGKSQTEGSDGRVLDSSDAKASMADRETAIFPPGPMLWKTASPSFAGQVDLSPPAGPVSPSARRIIGVPNSANKSPVLASFTLGEERERQILERKSFGGSKSVVGSSSATREIGRVILVPKASVGPVTVEPPASKRVAKELKNLFSEGNKLPTKPTKPAKTFSQNVIPRKKAPEPRLVKAEAVHMGHYSIQVAACRKSNCVSNYTELLKDGGFGPITKKTRNGKLTLIMTGTYQTLRAARPDLENLKERGFEKAHAIKR